MKIQALALVFLLPFLPAHAESLRDVQHDWAQANYQLTGEAQENALETLSARLAATIAESPTDAEMLIWDGIVKSTLAGKKGGLSALSLVKAARDSLEAAINIDPNALNGSAYTSLGALYYQVPGWPLGFGDDKKARKLLEKSVALNPQGIDNNYFYGDFLLHEKEYDAARTALEKALDAPDRPDRPVADTGRREEIKNLLATIRS